MTRLRSIIGLFLAALAAASCSDDTVTVDVFAASSLTDAFTVLEQRYEASHPGVDIRLNLAGSDTLRRQIDDGAEVDVFAPAALDLFAELGVDPTVYATNRLIIVATDEAILQRVSDDDVGGLLVAQCAVGVPCGDLAREALREAMLDVSGATITSESNVRAVLSKVVLGEADLGFVYVSDFVSAGSTAGLLAIEVPVPGADDSDRPSASLGIAALADGEGLTARHARGFTDFVVGSDGAEVFESLGFDPAP